VGPTPIKILDILSISVYLCGCEVYCSLAMAPQEIALVRAVFSCLPESADFLFLCLGILLTSLSLISSAYLWQHAFAVLALPSACAIFAQLFFPYCFILIGVGPTGLSD
jgi:hypothetical protein